MPTFAHQTARLQRGAHRSPSDGACAVELASLLAGEGFTDRPASVSPVLAAFVRGYNDAIDPARRQDLLAIAALAPGSVGAGEPARRELAGAWCRALWGRTRVSWWLRPRYPDPDQVLEAAGRDTARRVRAGDAALHDRALAFLRALAALDRPNSPTRDPSSCSWSQGVRLTDQDHREGIRT